MVYTRETHPGENIRSHVKLDEKLEHARLFKQIENVKLRLLVDSLDGRIHRMYGMLPNMVYIISKEGRIIYKASWTDSRRLTASSATCSAGRRKGFTPLDSVAVVEKYHFIMDRNKEEQRESTRGRARER